METAHIHKIAGRLTLRHLRAIVAIEEARSLVAAAKALNLTQPTITKTLSEAEGAIGAALFERASRGVIPNSLGEALVRNAKLMLSQLRHAALELEDIRDGKGGRVSAGTLLTGAAHLLPRAIVQLLRSRPRLIISVTEGTNDVLIPALKMGDIDFVVGRLSEYRQREGLAQEVLYEDSACLVVRREHPLAARRDLRLNDLVGFPWILPRADTTLRRQIDKDFHDFGLEAPPPAVESVSILANRRLLLDSDYISVWPRPLVDQDGAQSRVIVLPIELPSTRGSIGITTRRGVYLSSAASDCIESIREVARSPFKAR